MDKDGYHGYDMCKHDWHFVANTETLKCSRCGEITGPRTYEERVQDILEYDTTQFYMPTGQLHVANFKPNYNLTFHRDGQEVGKFDFNGPELSLNHLYNNDTVFDFLRREKHLSHIAFGRIVGCESLGRLIEFIKVKLAACKFLEYCLQL